MSKFSVAPIIKKHVATLQDDRTGRPRWQDWVVLYGFPAAAGAITKFYGVRLDGIGEVVGGLSILAGFLFGILIFVFQLRMQAASDPRVAPQGSLVKLLDQLFANVNYSVVVGFLTATVAIAASATRVTCPDGSVEPLNQWWSSVLVVLFLHLMLLLGMALKRLAKAYQELV
jgi:hypothetical protein